MTTEPVNESISPGGAPSRKWRLAVTVISLVVTLLVAEAALWLTDQPRFPRPHTFPPQFMLVGEPDTGGWIHHVNKPSEKILFRYESDPRDYFGPRRTVTHTTNSLGFRGDEFPLQQTRGGRIVPDGRKSDALRIVFLGDSVTFGEGVHDTDTFVQRVGRQLRTRLDFPVEVYNFGVGGHNTSDALWTWQRYGRHLDADLVVYTFVLNDAEPRLFRLDRATGQPARVPRSIESWRAQWTSQPGHDWWSGSRLARLSWKMQAGWKLDARTLEYYRELNASDSPTWKTCRDQLEALQRIEPTLAIVIFPMLVDLATHPFRPVHLEVADACKQAEVIDLQDALARRAGGNTPGLWVHPTDTHPNEIAHEVAAGVISKRLETLLRVPAKPPLSVP